MRRPGGTRRSGPALLALLVLVSSVGVGCTVAASPPASVGASPAARSSEPASSAAIASSSPTPTDPASADPAACALYSFSQRRCDAIVAWAVTQLPRGHAAVASAQLLPDPCRGADGRILCNRSLGFVARVRLTLVDGTSSEFEPYCMPPSGPGGLVCSETPGITAIDLHARGYWDVPCSGEGPSGCATPVVADPSAVAASRPLEIASLDIPVGAVGHHEAEVGQAVLPNGILSDATFKLGNGTQEGFLLDPSTITMEVRSTDPARPAFDNIHLRGRFPGTETVRVLLVYDVAETSATAVLQVRDLVVR